MPEDGQGNFEAGAEEGVAVRRSGAGGVGNLRKPERGAEARAEA